MKVQYIIMFLLVVGCSAKQVIKRENTKRDISSMISSTKVEVLYTATNYHSMPYFLDNLTPAANVNGSFNFAIPDKTMNTTFRDYGVLEIIDSVKLEDNSFAYVGLHKSGKYIVFKNTGFIQLTEVSWKSDKDGMVWCEYHSGLTPVKHLHSKSKLGIYLGYNGNAFHFGNINYTKHKIDHPGSKEDYKCSDFELITKTESNRVITYRGGIVNLALLYLDKEKYLNLLQKLTGSVFFRVSPYNVYNDDESLIWEKLISREDVKLEVIEKFTINLANDKPIETQIKNDNELCSIINSKSGIVTAGSTCRNFKWGRFAFSDTKSGLWGFTDDHGSVVVKTSFEKVSDFTELGQAKVKLNNKWGVIDYMGNYIIPPIYNRLDINTRMGLVVAEKDEKFGVLALDGKDTVYANFDFSSVKVVNSKYIVLCKGDSCSTVDSNGKIVESSLPYQDILPINSNLFVIKDKNGYELVDANNNEKIDTNFEEYKLFENINSLAIRNGKNWKLINLLTFEISNIVFKDIWATSKFALGVEFSGKMVLIGNNLEVIYRAGNIYLSSDNKFAIADDIVLLKLN